MPARQRIIVVTGRHRPHEQLLLAYSVLLGIAYLTVAPRPSSVVAVFPPEAVTVWALALGTSGVAGLIGCWWRGERGLGVECGGLLMNAGAMVIYSTAAFTVGGWRALLPAGVALAWALANLWRASQALRDIKEVRSGK